MEDVQTTGATDKPDGEVGTIEQLLTRVAERDLDLVFVEEFYSSSAFAQYFGNLVLANLTLPELLSKEPIICSNALCTASKTELLNKEHKFNSANFIQVRHSVRDEDGETDILVTYQGDNGKVWYVLIENKIRANFQDKQAERYRIRGHRLVCKNNGAGFTTVLLAPESYFVNAPNNFGFESVVSYEAIQNWFIEATELGKRANYKISVVQAALEKRNSRAGVKIVNEFCWAYGNYLRSVQAEFKDIVLKSDLTAERSDTWIYFNPPPNLGTSAHIYLVHKALNGEVGLYFPDKAENLNEIKTQYAAYTKANPALTIRKAGKAVTLTLPVARLDTGKEFTQQENEAREAFQALTKLIEIYRVSRNL